jgi:uncharacterized protein
MLAGLLRPKTYPHPAASVEHLQTHISHVFLAGDYAYKLKKPVDLGFLDFTTLAKRAQACADEVRLNARLAPDIYLGVVTICMANGRYRVADAGCVPREALVDYMVRMRRMPQESMLDRLAASAQLKIDHILDIARQMAAFHTKAEHHRDLDRYGRLDSIAAPIRQNFQQTQPYIDTCLPRARFERLRDYSENFLRDHAGLFDERIRRGRIVDGHGDLHLGNMCLLNDRVVIFDCIEFNPALRAGDAINDIAFLTMDLTERKLPQLATAFLNEYLQLTGDYHGLALLDFYQVYRAYVRGKVNAFQIDGASDAAARDRARQNAHDYFALAEQLLKPRRGGVLITCGLSGSGKTTLALQASARLDGVLIRSDVVRKQLAGMTALQRDATGYGEGIYNQEMNERTYAALLDQARDIIAAGRWAIIDATFSTRAWRDAAATLAGEYRAPFVILHCSAPRAELVRRLTARAADNRDASDATAALLEQQSCAFQLPDASEGQLHTCTPDTPDCLDGIDTEQLRHTQ